MSTYHRFEGADIISTVLTVFPEVSMASGSTGWRGNVGTSSSLSLYGGLRSRELTEAANGLTVRPRYVRDTYTIDGELAITGSYPMTGSIHLVKVRSVDMTTRDATNWGKEHFDPIVGLYEYYSRISPEYTTSSYDFYSLFFYPGTTTNRVSFDGLATASNGSTGLYDTISASFTVEARIKPFRTSGSNDFDIVGKSNAGWRLMITGSTGRLAFVSSSGVTVTSSFGPTLQRWNRVAFSLSAGTGSFLIDMVDAGSSGGLGNVASSPAKADIAVGGLSGSSFQGLIYDVRLWNVARTFAQLSSSFLSTFYATGSTPSLVLYARMNDGPSSTLHGKSQGSGTFDHSQYHNHGVMVNFAGRTMPVWHPNDDSSFVTQRALVGSPAATFLKVVHVPSIFYGRQIATGSVELTCNAFTSGGLIRVLNDDGRGGLYISGSVCSSSLDARESYTGVRWPKVGNVFYAEGLIIIRDPALLDFGEGGPGNSSLNPNDLFTLRFRGTSRIPSKVISCRIGAAEANASNNPTFARLNASTGKYDIVGGKPVTYITAVGLYDGDRRLVAVAKLAQPIRKREKDRQNIRLRFDF